MSISHFDRAIMIQRILLLLAALGLSVQGNWPPFLWALGAIVVQSALQRAHAAGQPVFRGRVGLLIPLLTTVIVPTLVILYFRERGGVPLRESVHMTLFAMCAVKHAQSLRKADLHTSAFLLLCLGYAHIYADEEVLRFALTQALAAAYILACFYSLLLLQSRQGWALFAQEDDRKRLLRTFQRVGPLLLLVYLIVPELNAYWQQRIRGQWGNTARTGISTALRPGDIASLGDNDTPVAFVDFQKAEPMRHSHYWKVGTLSSGFGLNWDAAASDFRVHGLSSGEKNRISNWQDFANVHLMHAAEGALIFPQSDFPVRLRMPAEGNPRESTFSLPNGLSRSGRGWSDESMRYTVQYSQGDLRETPGPEEIHTEALQPQPGSWLDLLRQRLENPRAIQSFFRKGSFVYSRTPTPVPVKETATQEERLAQFELFLRGTREGFCEHYAAAAVTLMRWAKIPARVVIGFAYPEWPGPGSSMVIRKSDAHAWFEWWNSDEERWIPEDPTQWVSNIQTVNIHQRSAGPLKFLSRLAHDLEEFLARFELSREFFERLSSGLILSLLMLVLWFCSLASRFLARKLKKARNPECRILLEIESALGKPRNQSQTLREYFSSLHSGHDADILRLSDQLVQELEQRIYGAPEQGQRDHAQLELLKEQLILGLRRTGAEKASASVGSQRSRHAADQPKQEP